MKVAFITRSTLKSIPGGDTVQVRETARQLEASGVRVDVLAANEKILYSRYDLLHLFNIIRPADLLLHAKRCNIPYVVTPILVDYSEYDKRFRKGLSGRVFRLLSPSAIEYVKTLGRWLTGNDPLVSKAYIWKGHKRSMQEILQKAACILPNSATEAATLARKFKRLSAIRIIPNGADTGLFKPDNAISREKDLIICAARIEGIKNQLNLIKAMNNSGFKMLLIGAAAPNQVSYYQHCRKIAGANIQFTGNLPQHELAACYQRAAVHILPSWFETCGLSSLEAAASGCNIVITDKGFAKDYFGNDAFYCDPGDPGSILEAVKKAASFQNDGRLQKKISEEFTWQHAAEQTVAVYKQILQH
ncbi:MAG: glycosyltransferase family 4 protein [Chitinophagaceae bacterium]|nr:glycosyltransferase family 4 protein [Chitinophagaceae bacterium]